VTDWTAPLQGGASRTFFPLIRRTSMRKLLLATTALLALSVLPAKAEFILASNTFAELGATGFGNAPRLLSLQNTPFENGAVVSNGGATQFLNNITIGPAPTFTVNGTPCTGGNTCTAGLLVNQSALVNVTSLWTSGANVGVGLDTNQIGSTGALFFNELVLNIYNSTGTLLGTFGGNDPVLISEAQLALQQGNGNSVFNLLLTNGTGGTTNEQAEFDAILAGLPPGGQIFAGLAAAFGCSPAPCVVGASNDGADSFLAFSQTAVVAIPEPATWAMLILGFFGIGGLSMMRKRREGRPFRMIST
jgi:hypothetical protein